jgi:hypothetical protein
MSYARFGAGPDGESSDIYLFAHVSGFVQCCGCVLRPWIPDEESENLHNATEVVEHLRVHVAAGHNVAEELLDPALYPDDDFVPYIRPTQKPNPIPLVPPTDSKDPSCI